MSKEELEELISSYIADADEGEDQPLTPVERERLQDLLLYATNVYGWLDKKGPGDHDVPS